MGKGREGITYLEGEKAIGSFDVRGGSTGREAKDGIMILRVRGVCCGLCEWGRSVRPTVPSVGAA